VVLFAFVVSALAVVLAYRRFADPERVRAEAEALLQQFAHGRVRVGSAAFSIFDGIHLYDVAVASAPPEERSVRDSNIAPETWCEIPISHQVFSCREVLISHDPVSALWGRLRIRSVVAVEPICSIVHDRARGTTNIAGLFQVSSRMDRAEVAMPTIELRDARIRVVYSAFGGERERIVEDLALTLRGRPSQRNPGIYDVVWQGGADTAGSGHSQIDLQSGYIRNVRGGLPSLSIETVMLAVNAGYDGAGAWSDLLGLDGRVRATDYNLIDNPGAPGNAPRSATIDLHHASLSIPIHKEERTLASDQRYLRFENVDGTVLVTTNAIRAEFTGRFHGSECKVTATMRGGVERLATLDDVDFDAQLTVTALNLPRSDPEAPPEQVRFIQGFPQLAKFFRDFDPHGAIDVDVEAAKRAGHDEPLEVRRILVTARGKSDASVRQFPYRSSLLTGSVEYRPDGVWIQHVCGEYDAGAFCVDGRLDRPDPCAAAELSIRGEDILIDDELYRGLGARYGWIRDQLRPLGRIDVDLALHRSACIGDEPGTWRSETTVRFDDLSASYVGLPYPVDHLAGELIVDGKQLRIVRLDGDAGKAQVHVTGDVALASPESPEMDVTIVADGAEFDDRLLTALPESIRTSIAALHPSGRFDLRTSLAVDPETRQVLSRSTVKLRGASVRPDSFPVMLTDVEGRVRIEPSVIAIDDVVGRYRDATISATGTVGRSVPQQAWSSHATPQRALELALHCRELRIDDELRAAAPPKLRGVLTDWSVDGPISADILIRRDSTGEDDLTYHATAELDGVNVRSAEGGRFPILFEDVHGTMTIEASGVRGIGFHGRYGVAEVQVDFDTHETSEGEEGTIVLNATGLPLDENVRGFLPEGMYGGWDRAGLQGVVNVHCNELHYRKAGGSPNPTWQVDGRIDLHQVDALADLVDLSGTLTVSGSLVDRLGGATLAGRLHLATARVHSRTLSDIESAWSLVRSANGAGRLSLAETHAAIYGGALTGQAEMLLAPDRTDYDLTALVYGMQIAPWLQAGRNGLSESSPLVRDSKLLVRDSNLAPHDDSATQIRGTADAQLYLSGVVGDPLSRRGGGQLDVRDGYIYRLPILLAILNVLDMSVPNDEALHELEADFFVLGNRLQFDTIALHGGSLNLVGSGSMSLPDQAVDLRLVNVGVRSWARVPVLTDLVDSAVKEFVELRVTGPVSRPTVRAQPLRGLSEEFKRLFQKKPAKKIIREGS
jgi:hypothetical protein